MAALLAAMAAVVLIAALFSGAWARRVDLRVLWPLFKANAPSLDMARVGFIHHMALDSNWQKFTAELSEEEFNDWIERVLV